MEQDGTTEAFNIRGELALLIGRMACWKCAEEFAVGAFGVFAGSELRDDEEGCCSFVPLRENHVVRRVQATSEAIAAFVRSVLPTFRIAFSMTTQSSYWMSHCPKCDAPTGDFYAQSPDGPFFSWEWAQNLGVEVLQLGRGELDCEPPFDDRPTKRTSLG